MKVDAHIKFTTGDETLGIQAGDREVVTIDKDYVEEMNDVVQMVEDGLAKAHGVPVLYSHVSSDNGRFVIENLEELYYDCLTTPG